MYTAKHATLYKHRVPDGQPYVFYIDIRAGGKGYEEFVQHAIAEEGALYLRGRVSKIFEDDGNLVVWGVDTLTGQKVEIEADLVVLAVAITPRALSRELARKLKVNTDAYGFLSEAHPKLRPVETLTAGIFLAGCGQAPRDIPESVAQASGAASKVLAMFSRDKLEQLPTVAVVDEELCSGCGLCVPACPYSARELDEKKAKALVNEALCEGCGACVSACPNGASQQKNFSTNQIMAMIEVSL
jgi:heterodisulfide reductase subunit A